MTKTKKRRPPPMGFDLAGWPEILPVIELTEVAAHKATQREHDPLPVQRWFSGAVIARRSELDAWLAREKARASA